MSSVEIRGGSLVSKQGASYDGQKYDILMTLRDADGKIINCNTLGKNDLEIVARYVDQVASERIKASVSSSQVKDPSRWGWVYLPQQQELYSITAPEGDSVATLLQKHLAAKDYASQMIQELPTQGAKFPGLWQGLHTIIFSPQAIIATHQASYTKEELFDEYLKFLSTQPQIQDITSLDDKRKLKKFFTQSLDFWKDHEDWKAEYREKLLNEVPCLGYNLHRQVFGELLSLEELLLEMILRKTARNGMIQRASIPADFKEIMSTPDEGATS